MVYSPSTRPTTKSTAEPPNNSVAAARRGSLGKSRRGASTAPSAQEAGYDHQPHAEKVKLRPRAQKKADAGQSDNEADQRPSCRTVAKEHIAEDRGKNRH
jgi:hypothetical protein